MGPSWQHRKDSACDDIMQDSIVPYCKKGNYSGASLSGVRALDRLARKDAAASPAPATPASAPVGVPTPANPIPPQPKPPADDNVDLIFGLGLLGSGLLFVVLVLWIIYRILAMVVIAIGGGRSRYRSYDRDDYSSTSTSSSWLSSDSSSSSS